MSLRFRRDRSGWDRPIEIAIPFMRQIPAQRVIRLLHFTEMNLRLP